ncbi:cupin-like domain-containing protein [Cellulomonas fengjieae]|uniref:Cupin-like domain-containing protein n=1 Tax=Cellulomonas fengjieae TaxID=2819978 RepID=A0ABS3SDY5_9CELL|nr:cupin-like domain-containing protein [Cellulomonas fengjieae]MBO3083947.1 cupin-like domain-containing protein [Cellulomonas fengjieae]MBO3101302.1 cupin-like domain-containing protein [Cellulomonas fengjieae]QVI64779.1 cupin-like domain-containing protein [Cellulomonas fengjieae]
MHLDAVPRVDRNDFRVPRLGGEPRVVVGNVAGWPALERWDSDYLRAVAGGVEVVVRERNGPPNNMYQHLAQGGAVPFGDYLDWVLATAGDLQPVTADLTDPRQITGLVAASRLDVSYYLDANLVRLSPTLTSDAPDPQWFRRPAPDVNFWCGVQGTSSGLHCDVSPNCNVQVVGSKHFSLFPPSSARRLGRIGHGTHCRVDPNALDLRRFPRAADVRGFETTLGPGESLYIPVGWFHQVTVTSAWAVNVNFFWPRPFPQGLAVPMLWGFLLRRGRARLARTLGGG